MKIGIIGAGYVGRGVAQLAANTGHDVMISNSRDPRSLHSVVGTLKRDSPDGVTIIAGTADQAGAFGDPVLIALPLAAAINVGRIADWIAEKPLATTRQSARVRLMTAPE